ncbi:MAG: long-chain-fatty-acid--CoA ligase [Pseudomonadota bacterium]
MKELIYHRSFMPALGLGRERPAVVDASFTATFEEHANRVFRLVHALRHQFGFAREDRFAVLARNSHVYLELYHAAFLGGGVVNPLNLRLSAQELDYIICDSGVEVVFVDQHFAPLLREAMAVSDACPVRRVVLIGEGEGPFDHRYEDVLAAAQPEVPEEPEEEDVVVLMYTGGTTGLPKGVVLTQRALILNMYHSRISRPTLGPDTVSLIQTPMFHVASMGTLVTTYIVGGTTVIVPGFEAELVMSEIERNKVTSTLMVPTMIGMMVNHANFAPERLASLRQLTYGASPMPAVTLDRLLTLFPDLDLYQGYGMTESSAILTSLSPDDHRQGGKRIRSVGQPVVGLNVVILDEDGVEVKLGEIGEVCARGGNFMREYWNKPEATQEAFRGGWYHTGDAGYFDEDGYLFLVDRVKDMIITGGENVYSAEVENAIASHQAVNQVAVIGIPHATWGEAVHAIVVLKDGAEASEADIIAHARGSIAGFKVPKSVDFRADPLPLSGAMKVLKRELRRPFWEGQDKGIS